MNNKLTDLPVYFSLDDYQTALKSMVDKLIQNKNILSIYQVGGLSTPGISDIDLYLIFKNDAKFSINPVIGLNHPGNYFFTHRLFGTCEKYATQLEKFTFFRNYKLLAGANIKMDNYDLNDGEIETLKHQIAIEYLIKAWITISLSSTFKLIKVRDLLLIAKAILYDIEFLQIKDKEFADVIGELMTIRKNWFESKNPGDKILTLLEKYKSGLHKAVTNSVASYRFYKSSNTNSMISKKVRIKNESILSIERLGLLLPTSIMNSSVKLIKIHKNLNNFIINIPIRETKIPDILVKRQQTINEAILYNNTYLPGFLCTAYAMNIFEITEN